MSVEIKEKTVLRHTPNRKYLGKDLVHFRKQSCKKDRRGTDNLKVKNSKPCLAEKNSLSVYAHFSSPKTNT